MSETAGTENSWPKITLVTPSFNQADYLDQTIRSVLDQEYPNLEYMVIDGGSTDHSVEVIKKYEDRLTYWVSEKDKGQSDAINKGLARATGHLFNWLNSDDYLEPGALFSIAEAYQQHPDKKAFCFGLTHLKGDTLKAVTSKNDLGHPLQCVADPVIKQPATFYTLEAVKAFGGLSAQLHYTMDYEWWVKCMLLYGTASVYSSEDRSVAVFRLHDEAKTAQGQELFVNDIANILYSLLEQNRLDALAQLFSEKYTIKKDYRFSLPAASVDAKLVERMAHYFLLKWNNYVDSPRQFAFSRKLVKFFDRQQVDLTARELAWKQNMEKTTNAPNMLMWKLFRKTGLIR